MANSVTSLTDANVLKGLVNLLECPICYETPRQTDKTVGTCYFGHIVCKTCFNAMQGTRNLSCPQCRKHMYMSQNNYLVNGILSIIEQGQIFKCSYDNCDYTGHARQMVQHEKICILRPIQCINKNCPIQTPFIDLANNSHPCLTIIRKCDKASTGNDFSWEFTLNIKDVFDMEQNGLCLSKRLLPMWLALPCNGNWRVYFYPIIRRNTLELAVGWMSRKEAAPTMSSKVVYRLALTLDSKWGLVTEDKLYYTDSIDPYKNMPEFDIVEQEEESLRNKYGPFNPVTMSCQTLLEWIGQCRLDTCTTCNSDVSQTGPHFHISIDIKTIL